MQLHKGHFISDLLRADKKVRWQYKLHRRKMSFGNFYSSTILYVCNVERHGKADVHEVHT